MSSLLGNSGHDQEFPARGQLSSEALEGEFVTRRLVTFLPDITSIKGYRWLLSAARGVSEFHHRARYPVRSRLATSLIAMNDALALFLLHLHRFLKIVPSACAYPLGLLRSPRGRVSSIVARNDKGFQVHP